jgi:diguanylate cyclase (GGDEF)-like protein
MGDTGVGRRVTATPSSSMVTSTITVPGFELLAELGHGATTVVYRARRAGDAGPDVALKILREQTDLAADVAAGFRREAALLARVTHPCLAAVHAAGEAGGRPYLVLELVEGASLTRLIEDGPLPEGRLLGIAIDAADALTAVHRMRLVHRDIKPQNLLVTPTGRTKLIDFDLATWNGEVVPGDTVTGTFAYSAPEQTGMLTRPVDARTDLYALGVVLFECVTGRPPFASPDIGELLHLHAVVPAPDVRSLRPGCSPGLAAVIAKLLAKDPDDRYQSATGLLSDLRRVRDQPGDWPFELDTAGNVAASPAAPLLVGRRVELSQLTGRWDGAADRGGVVLVEGAAGTGKSRLVDELVAHATGHGGCVLRADCSPDERPPLGDLASAVRRHIEAVRSLPTGHQAAARLRLREVAGDAAPLLATLSPTVADALGADDALLAGADRQEQIPTAIASFLAALARRDGRLLLVIEDAQHLDATSERVLSHLRLDDGAPLLIVVTGPPDTGDALESGLGTPVDLRITLGPLVAPTVAELIANELGGADVPDEVATQLVLRTGGNPFAVLEFLRHLIEAGGLQPSWGTWRLDGELLDRLHLPSDVLDLVLARLEGLPAKSRRLLAAAAVQGMRFDTTVLAASTRVRASASEPAGGDVTAAADEIGDVLAAAIRQRVVDHVNDDVYAFVHIELRDALLTALDEQAIAHLHHRIAEALHARGSDSTEHVYMLARHWMAAGPDADPVRTHEACVTAGHTALAQHAPRDAVEFLANAAAAADVAGITVDVAFRQAHATAQLRAGHFDDAAAQLEDALATERDPLRRAELMNLLATAEYSAGDGERAITTVVRGLATLDVAPPGHGALVVASTIARFLAGLVIGALPSRLGTATGARRQWYVAEAKLLETGMYAAGAAFNDRVQFVFLLRSLFPANRSGLSPQRVRSLAGLGYLAAMAHAPRMGLRTCATAERAAARIGDPSLVAFASFMHGVVKAMADTRTAPVIDALEAHGQWLVLPYYLLGVASVVPHLASVGYTAVADLWVDRARRRLRLGGPTRDAFPIECMAGALQAIRGRATAADATMRAALATAPDDLTLQQRMLLAWARLIILTEQGEFGDAYDDVVADIDAAPISAGNHSMLGICYTVTFGRLAQAHAATGAERARRLAQARTGIRTLRRGRRMRRLQAGRLAFRAWALHLAGRNRAAQRMVHRAHRVADDADAPLLSFDILVVHARTLRALGLEPEAQRKALTALSLATEHGWEYRARWIRDEFSVRDARHGTRRSPTGTSSREISSSGHATIHERRRLDAVTQVSTMAASVLDPEELMQVALDITVRLLSAERIFIFLSQQSPDGTDAVLVPHRGYDAEGNDLRDLTDYSSTLVDRVWETGETVVVTGSEQGAALGSESAVVHGLRSILVAPLQLKGRMLGVIYLDSRVARGIFVPEDADLLTTITQQVAAALETARAAQLEAEVRAANHQRDLAETMRASMTDLNSTLDPDEVLHRLVHVIRAALPGDRAVLALDDETLGGLATITAPVVAGARSPTALPEPLTDALGGPRSWLAVPVLLRQESVGVIVVGSSDPDAYADVHVEVAAALAEQGAVAYENARLFSRVEELATTDGLTSLATRHHFWRLAEDRLAAAARDGRPLAAVMLDIDHFKLVNDTHGHATGDAVLRVVADRLRTATRESDIVGRYGGEEFALIMSDTADASEFAERLRAAVADTAVPTDTGPVHVTISVGVSHRRAGEDLDALLSRADKALYRSKARGRDRVTVA